MLVAIVACWGLTWGVLAQQPQGAPPAPAAAQASASPPSTKTYDARCAACHGAKMTGGTASDILAYVRYHTDAELTAAIRTSHRPALQLSDDELAAVLAYVRVLAGTNPAMATGGFTGRSRGGGGARAGVPAGAGRGRGAGAGRAGGPTSIRLVGGRALSGVMMAQSEFDATMLVDNKFVLLARDGDLYREKPIAPKADWLNYHGSLAAGRYSTLDQINLGNIQKLGVAWMFPIATSTRLEGTPVVADGILYMTGWNEIFALDATTGRQLWTYSQPHTEGLLSEAGTGANRGAAIAGDRVLMVTDHAHLLAFNRFTGQKLWDVEVAPYTEGYSATVAPLVIGDLVIQGTAGGEEGVRGLLDAYRVSDGSRAWRFYTVPKRGEKGSETWIGQAIEHGCGSTWQTGSYDPELDLVYWGIGNPCPDHNGEERMGDNLYTSSVVALSAKTGELKWHYQFSPHDTHDWDAAQPMVLVDDVWQGRPRKLLLNANRNGMFYVLDRATGEFLQATNLSTKVTWHKGFTKEGRPIIDPGSIATRDGVAVCPGGSGGANMPDVSYNPITKLFYVLMSDSCTIFTAGDDPLSGGRWFGRGTAADPTKARDALNALLQGYTTSYYIRAMDPFTGKKVWDYAVPFGHEGVLSTAGGLVFAGSTAGGLRALDAKTGKPVWYINVGLSTSEASPMTYMVGGKQYIALAANGGLVAYALPN
jgi:alcohol dehydrogenase (cytochrome c)